MFHTLRVPDSPPVNTVLPSHRKHLKRVRIVKRVCVHVKTRVLMCLTHTHLCSSSACTVEMSIPVWTSVTAKHESSPTLRICRLSEHTHTHTGTDLAQV